jgi:hypothetical protein
MTIQTGPASNLDDVTAVTKLLGRYPEGNFVVLVRRSDNQPVVIVNDPLLRDGTPMPTRYWLVDPEIRARVSKLEANGGVKHAEWAVDPQKLIAAHSRYVLERDAAIPSDWTGPKPTGGVGGTRRGVKCLHAHIAWWIAGGDDPVGDWVAGLLGLDR